MVKSKRNHTKKSAKKSSKNIFEFSNCPSTQIEVEKLLADHSKQLPLTVIAASQSSGKGRQGRDWKSPKGNIYFSIALEMPNLSMPDRPKLSLIVASIISKWLRTEFGFAATIKWPNDIYFAGKKLGGILIDTSMDGDQVGPVMIGVGINLIPTKIKDDEIEAVSVSEILHQKISSEDVRKFARSLSQFLLEKCAEVTSDNYSRFIEESKPFQPSFGTPFFVPEQEDLKYFDGFSPLGTILYRDASLTQHDLGVFEGKLRWPTFSKIASTLNIADIGNTRVKVASGAFEKWGVPTDPVPLKTVFCASVNQNAFERLRRDLNLLDVRTYEIGKRVIRARYPNYDFNAIGIDRACLIEDYLGHVKKRSDREGALIVSLGTAVTIDIVRSQGEHCTGMIGVGLQTGLDALHVKTGRLPHVVLHEKSEFKGGSTERAMVHAATESLLGLLEQCRKIAMHEYHMKKVDLYFTGGALNEFVKCARLFKGQKLSLKYSRDISVHRGAYRMLRGG